MDSFWIVWCMGGGAPTVTHEHPDYANREAERLAAENPGRRFVVLRSERDFHMPAPGPVKTEHVNDIPF